MSLPMVNLGALMMAARAAAAARQQQQQPDPRVTSMSFPDPSAANWTYNGVNLAQASPNSVAMATADVTPMGPSAYFPGGQQQAPPPPPPPPPPAPWTPQGVGLTGDPRIDAPILAALWQNMAGMQMEPVVAPPAPPAPPLAPQGTIAQSQYGQYQPYGFPESQRSPGALLASPGEPWQEPMAQNAIPVGDQDRPTLWSEYGYARSPSATAPVGVPPAQNQMGMGEGPGGMRGQEDDRAFQAYGLLGRHLLETGDPEIAAKLQAYGFNAYAPGQGQIPSIEESRDQAKHDYEVAEAQFNIVNARYQVQQGRDDPYSVRAYVERLLGLQLGRDPTQEEVDIAYGRVMSREVAPQEVARARANLNAAQEKFGGYDAYVQSLGGEGTADRGLIETFLWGIGWPQDQVREQTGESMYNYAIGGGTWIDDMAETPIGNLLGYLGLGPQEWADWVEANRETVIQAHEYGYDADGDGVADYTGDRAVWEYFAASQNIAQRVINDLAMDPTNYLGALAGVGRIARAGGAAAKAGGHPVFGAILRVLGVGAEVPYKVVEEPVDNVFDWIIDRLGKAGGKLAEETKRSKYETESQQGQRAFLDLEDQPLIQAPPNQPPPSQPPPSPPGGGQQPPPPPWEPRPVPGAPSPSGAAPSPAPQRATPAAQRWAERVQNRPVPPARPEPRPGTTPTTPEEWRAAVTPANVPGQVNPRVTIGQTDDGVYYVALDNRYVMSAPNRPTAEAMAAQVSRGIPEWERYLTTRQGEEPLILRPQQVRDIPPGLTTLEPGTARRLGRTEFPGEPIQGETRWQMPEQPGRDYRWRGWRDEGDVDIADLDQNPPPRAHDRGTPGLPYKRPTVMSPLGKEVIDTTEIERQMAARRLATEPGEPPRPIDEPLAQPPEPTPRRQETTTERPSYEGDVVTEINPFTKRELIRVGDVTITDDGSEWLIRQGGVSRGVVRFRDFGEPRMEGRIPTWRGTPAQEHALQDAIQQARRIANDVTPPRGAGLTPPAQPGRAVSINTSRVGYDFAKAAMPDRQLWQRAKAAMIDRERAIIRFPRKLGAVDEAVNRARLYAGYADAFRSEGAEGLIPSFRHEEASWRFRKGEPADDIMRVAFEPWGDTNDVRGGLYSGKPYKVTGPEDRREGIWSDEFKPREGETKSQRDAKIQKARRYVVIVDAHAMLFPNESAETWKKATTAARDLAVKLREAGHPVDTPGLDRLIRTASTIPPEIRAWGSVQAMPEAIPFARGGYANLTPEEIAAQAGYPETRLLSDLPIPPREGRGGSGPIQAERAGGAPPSTERPDLSAASITTAPTPPPGSVAPDDVLVVGPGEGGVTTAESEPFVRPAYESANDIPVRQSGDSLVIELGDQQGKIVISQGVGERGKRWHWTRIYGEGTVAPIPSPWMRKQDAIDSAKDLAVRLDLEGAKFQTDMLRRGELAPDLVESLQRAGRVGGTPRTAAELGPPAKVKFSKTEVSTFPSRGEGTNDYRPPSRRWTINAGAADDPERFVIEADVNASPSGRFPSRPVSDPIWRVYDVGPNLQFGHTPMSQLVKARDVTLHEAQEYVRRALREPGKGPKSGIIIDPFKAASEAATSFDRAIRTELDRMMPGYKYAGDYGDDAALITSRGTRARVGKVIGEHQLHLLNTPMEGHPGETWLTWMSGRQWDLYTDAAKKGKPITLREAAQQAASDWANELAEKRGIQLKPKRKRGAEAGLEVVDDLVVNLPRETILYGIPGALRRIFVQYLGNPISLLIAGEKKAALRSIFDPRARDHLDDFMRKMGWQGEHPGNVPGITPPDQFSREGALAPERLLRKLPGGHVYGGLGNLVANRYVRDLANGMDNFARRWLAYTFMRRQLPSMRTSLIDSGRRYAERNLPRGAADEIEDAIRKLDRGGFSREDVRQAVEAAAKRSGATDPQAFNAGVRMGRDWANAQYKMQDEALKRVRSVLFAGGDRNYEQALGKLILFNFWMSRATVMYARELAKKPGIINAAINAWNSDLAEAKRTNAPSWLQNFLAIVGDPVAGRWLFADPTALFSTYLFFREKNEDEGWFRSTFAMVPALEWLYNAAGYAGDAPMPDFFGQQANRNALRRVTNIVRNATGDISDLPNAADWIDVANGKLRGALSGILPGSEKVEYIPPGATNDARFLSSVWAIAIEHGMDPNEVAAQLADPNSPLLQVGNPVYEEAWDRWATGEAVALGLSFAFPVPTYTLPTDWELLKAVQNGERVLVPDGNGGWLAVDTNAVAPPVQMSLDANGNPVPSDSEGSHMASVSAADDPSLNWPSENPYGDGVLTEDEMAFLRAYELTYGVWPDDEFFVQSEQATQAARQTKQIITSGGEHVAPLEYQLNQEYETVGTPFGRAVYDAYESIEHGTRSGPITVGGQTITPTQIRAMTPDQRRALAYTWASEHRLIDDYAAQKAAREQYESDHMELADYRKWQGDVYGYTDPSTGDTGVLAWWDRASTQNESIRQYYNEQRELHAGSAGDLERALTNPDAYFAVLGERETVYDPERPSAGSNGSVVTPTGDPTMPLPSGGEGGQSDQPMEVRIANDLAEWQQQAAVASAIIGADYTTLLPFYRDMADNVLRGMGMEPPSLDWETQQYLAWAQAQPPGSDISTTTYAVVFQGQMAQRDVLAVQYLMPGGNPTLPAVPLESSGYGNGWYPYFDAGPRTFYGGGRLGADSGGNYFGNNPRRLSY